MRMIGENENDFIRFCDWNSEYVAEKIGRALSDQTLNLFARIRDRDVSALTSERQLIMDAIA